MGIRISERARKSLRLLDIVEESVGECFANRLSDPPLIVPHGLGPDEPSWYWIVGETNEGLLLSVYYALLEPEPGLAEEGTILVKDVHEPTRSEMKKFEHVTGIRR